MSEKTSYLDSVMKAVIENSKTHYPIISSDIIEPAAWELATLRERVQRLEAATAFEVMPQVFRNGRAYGEITIERRKQLGGETKWAVLLRNTFVLNTDMQWEYEPIPSSRTDEFIANTRFDLDTAWRMAEEAAKKELEHAAALEGAK